MITLSLFLIAMWELLGSFEDESSTESVKEIGKRQSDIKRQLCYDKNDDKPRLTLQKVDMIPYEEYLNIVLKKETAKEKSGHLADRYGEIKLKLFNRANFPTFKEATDFHDKINDVTMLKINVPDVYDAYTVFSSLNYKGLPLTLIDLFKTEYLQKAVIEVGEEKALADWDSLAKIFSNREGEPNTREITQFLLYNHDAFEGQSNASMTKDEALEEYKKIIIDKGHDYINILKKRAEVFVQITGTRDIKLKKSVNAKIEELRSLDTTTAYPLLLVLLTKKEELDIENCIDIILDDLIKFYVRRNIVLIPKSSNIRSETIGIIREISDKKLSGEEVKNHIRSVLVKMRAPDEIFRSSLRGKVYGISEQTTRSILIKIERKYGTYFDAKEHIDNLDEYIRTGKKKIRQWSIEHILPSGKLPQHWVDSISNGNRSKATEIQDAYADRIGNLTLTPYNSELGQRPFYNENNPGESKRDLKNNDNYVGLRMGLFLNKSIPGEEEKIEEKKEWTVEDIDRRTEFIVKLIMDGELYRLD